MRHLTTPTFEKEFAKAQIRNKTLSYAEKQVFWDLCVCDWQNGKPASAYIPFPAAKRIHQSRARFITIAAGNRFAKSMIASMEAVAAMMVPGAFIWICAPQLKLAAQGEWPYIQQSIIDSDLWAKFIKPTIRDMLIEREEYTINEDPVEEKKQYDKEVSQRRYLSIRNGLSKSIEILWPGAPNSKVETVSYNNRRDWIKLEGAKITLLIFAEGSRVPLEVWERHLRKRLSDTFGRVIIPCTPKGRDQFLFPSYEKGMSSKLDVQIDRKNCTVTHSYIPVKKHPQHVDIAIAYTSSFETFHHPAFDNPYYNMDDYESDKRDLFDNKLDESTFLERCFGCFVSMSGQYYIGLDWKKCTIADKDVEIPSDATHYVSIDPGRSTYASIHWIAICKPDERGVEKWIIYDEIYKSGMWADTIVKAILDKNKELGVRITRYICDRADKSSTHHAEKSVHDNLRSLGLRPLTYPWHMPYGTVNRLNKWKPQLMKGNFVIVKDKCPMLITEMMELEYAREKVVDGKTEKVEKLAGDTHALDDITYAVYSGLSWQDWEAEEEEREVERKENEPLHHDSAEYIIGRAKFAQECDNSLIGMIGSW